MPLNILFAGWSNDPFVETIERHLQDALTARGGHLLRVVEGRSPADDGIPTIDLDDALQLGANEFHNAAGTTLPPSFDSIVESTIWFERTAGLPGDEMEVRNRLQLACQHIRSILQTWPCDAVCVWNGLLGQRAVIAAVAHEMLIPVWYCERGPLPGSWYADPVGINGNSSLVEKPLAAGLAEALASPLSPRRRAGVLAELKALSHHGRSAWEQPGVEGGRVWRQRLSIPEGKRVLFFPLQVDADTNMRFFSPHFPSSMAALKAVVDALADKGGVAMMDRETESQPATCAPNLENPPFAEAKDGPPGIASDDRWCLLVKPHPKGSYDLAEIERLLATVDGRLCDMNIQDALALASLVVTINSTTAAEAVWQDRPVLQLGRGLLSGKGIVPEYDPARPLAGQLDDAARQWHDEPHRYERSLCFYDFLRRHHLLQAHDEGDAARLIARFKPSNTARAPTGGPPEVSGRFAWRPAVELLRAIRSREQLPESVLLLGFGQNCRRLLHAASLAGSVPWKWTIWDDDPARREQAAHEQSVIEDPFVPASGKDRETVADHAPGRLVVVTPCATTGLESRLAAHGLKKGEDYLCIAPPRGRPAG